MELKQLNLFGECAGRNSALVNDAIEALAKNGGAEARGAVFTRLEVVDFILDLAGYTEDQPLQKKRILEPSCGSGDFLLAIVRRLLKAWRTSKGMSALDDLGDAVRAVELHHSTYNCTYGAVVDVLKGEGLPEKTAASLAGKWLLRVIICWYRWMVNLTLWLAIRPTSARN